MASTDDTVATGFKNIHWAVGGAITSDCAQRSRLETHELMAGVSEKITGDEIDALLGPAVNGDT